MNWSGASKRKKAPSRKKQPVFSYRAAGMINRVSSEGDIVFTGGVAKNPCMHELLEEKLGRKVLIPDDPQLVGALGAALLTML